MLFLLRIGITPLTLFHPHESCGPTVLFVRMAHATRLVLPLHGLIIVYTIKSMEITFDPDKDAANLQKHGLSLSRAVALAWETALVWDDDRCHHGEPRQAALALLGTRVHL